MQYRPNSLSLSKSECLQTLVENRTSYTLERCELNVFETYTESYNVPLKFNDFVITSMLRGKKIMHLFDQQQFDYIPGETVIVPADQAMKIDFPEAADNNPTQCIALAIDEVQINKTISYLNEFFPKEDHGSKWLLNFNDYHLQNSEEIAALINKLLRICAERSLTKDIFADLTLKELLVRIMQSQNLKSAIQDVSNINRTSLSYVINYIRSNITEKLNMNILTDKACMSKATFYRLFKRELGVSPNEYILAEKINMAKRLLQDPSAKVTAISYQLGFTDANYFIKTFKKIAGVTPGSYQLQVCAIDK